MYTEYDPVSGRLYTFRVPGHQRFVRADGRTGVYFSQTARQMDVEGMEISIHTIDRRSELLWQDGGFSPLPWTYPDYRTELARSFFTEGRRRIKRMGKPRQGGGL